jgi:DNA-binding LacI/PurR family transcriptional regulator
MNRLGDLRTYLAEQARRAEVGDRLPTVRWLMREFGLSQASVQRALAELKAEGLIVAKAGRGTVFVGRSVQPLDDANERRGAGDQPRSVLVLRRLAGTRRGRVVLDALQRRLIEAGHRTLEVAYSDANHAGRVLQALPRFDACIVQNSFEPMPIEMLAALRRRTDAVIIDGAWLVGTDLDAVGFEWGEPVERAITLLHKYGHQRIGFATTANPFLANELGRQRYAHLQARTDRPDLLQPALLLRELPYQGYEAALVAALAAQVDDKGQLPFTGLIVWGIESGSAFRNLLDQAGIRVPQALSIVLLGRTDIEEEAAGFFTMIGCRASEQCDGLYDALLERWAHPQSPHRLRFMPIHECEGASVINWAKPSAATASVALSVGAD